MGQDGRLALPLAISTFFVSLSVNLPRLFLSWSASESTWAVFAVLCYFCFPATMLVSAIMQAATPRLASSYRDDPCGRYRQLSRRLMVACAAVAADQLVGDPLAWSIVARMWTLGTEYAGGVPGNSTGLAPPAGSATWRLCPQRR